MSNHIVITSIFAVLISPIFLFSPSVLAETKPAETDEKKVSIPIQGGLIERLEKAELHPSVTQKVVPPEGFKIPDFNSDALFIFSCRFWFTCFNSAIDLFFSIISLVCGIKAKYPKNITDKITHKL